MCCCCAYVANNRLLEVQIHEDDEEIEIQEPRFLEESARINKNLEGTKHGRPTNSHRKRKVRYFTHATYSFTDSDAKETIELEPIKSEVPEPISVPTAPEPVVFVPDTKPVPTIPAIPPIPIESSTIPEEPVNNENHELNNGSKSPAKKKPPTSTKPVSQPSKIWDIEERRKVETRNNNMRQIIYKEVKRPGRNYDKLLELLKELHGPAEIRQQYILDVMKEAKRFKRNHMAEIIMQNMPNLVSFDSSN